MRRRFHSLVVSLVFVAFSAGVSACSKEPTRWDKAAAQAESATPIVTASAPPKAGAALNKAFPADGVDGVKRVFTMEKDGFSEAKLQKDGKDIATISVADTRTNDDAKKKFAESTEKVGDYPVVTVGKNQTSMLVGERYQVKVSSPTLDHEARKAWLTKFDLAALAKM
jgi:hypothetical protein